MGFGLDRGVADQLDVVTSPAEVREMQKRAESVLVDDHVLAYIAALVRKTRQWPTLSLGASPRAGVAILRGARAVAALEGRDYVLPDDVQDVRLAGLAASRHSHARGRGRGTIRRCVAHRAHQVSRGSPAMKMIWPGRALGVALMVPALLSLALFVSESVWPLVLVLDAAVAMVAFFDLFTLAGSARLRVERHVGHVCSLDEPEDVELVVENPGRSGAVDAAARRRSRRILGGTGRI